MRGIGAAGTTSNCEAELEEVYGHELEHQIRRQLLIPRLEARQSEQAILLSNCEGELQEVSGHEHEQQKRRPRNADNIHCALSNAFLRKRRPGNADSLCTAK